MAVRKVIPIVIVLSIILISLPVQLLAQKYDFRKYAEQVGDLLIDYAAFAGSEPGRVRLEIYYQIYNSALNFTLENNIHEAKYEINIWVNDDKGAKAGSYSDEKTVQVASSKKAQSKSDFRVNQATFDLWPGKYNINFILSDPRSQSVVRRELKVNLNSFDNKNPRLSDIEFVQAVKIDDSSDSRFSKGNLIIIPSLNKSFGMDENDKFVFYVEVYQGTDSMDEITIETILRHDLNGMMYRDTIDTKLEEPVSRQLREITLDGFQPGEYDLFVRLLGRRNKKIDEKRERFEVPWNQKSLIRFRYNEAVTQLEYIADPGELKELKEIEDNGERIKAFNKFWASRDPDPTTEINELKVKFYYRINTANRLFTVMRREGWRTDRGRVLIQFGEPDQIDDFPFNTDGRPYQVWHYYDDGPYRKFTFVDENEDGDYRLIYPYDGLNQRPDF